MNFLLLLSLLITSLVAHADICGKEDDREASFDPRVGRLVKTGETSGCGATLIGNNCIVSIGSCAISRDYVEFNVPQSIAGVPQTAAQRDRYFVDPNFIEYQKGSIGNEWAVLKIKKNEVTQLDAGQVQGYYKVANKKSPKNSNIKVIGYGYALNDLYDIKKGEVPANKYPETLHFAQQVSKGLLVKSGIFLIPEILEHSADTSYGTWGGAIIDEKSNELIGITTHGGCRAHYTQTIGARYTNSGTSITGSKKFRNAVNRCLSLD